MSWRWLLDEVVIAIHDEQIAVHGGSPGIRDSGLLSSALARPKHKANYGDPSVFDLKPPRTPTASLNQRKKGCR